MDTLNKAAFEFDANDTIEGFEQINAQTMAIPFLRILQKLSPQLDKQKPEYIIGAEEGQWINSSTKEVYGSELKCIVLKYERIYIEWRPNRGGFVGYHDPDNAERLAVDKTFGAWKTRDGNLLQENYVYMLIIGGHEQEGVIVLSLSSSALKVAKEWNRLMTTHIMDNGKKTKPYYLVWSLGTDYKKNEKGTWYSPAPKFERYVDSGQYNVAKTERLMLPSRQVDYTQIEHKTETEDADTVF